jgi:acyl dehydratase
VTLRFARPQRLLRYVPRAVFARRSALLPDGVTLPRLEGVVERVRVSPAHLARYRDACGFVDDGWLPVTYPHVLATSLHVALMTQPAFLVRLMGLVHVANLIEWRRPLAPDREYGLRSWLEGHEETDRGQEFLLNTELLDAEGVAWAEQCRLLARRQVSGTQAARTARATLKAPRPADGLAAGSVPFAADHATIRRYSRVSGDLNPIHLADFSARWYGFDRAVAHGMWSMARSLAAIGPGVTERPCRIPVEFKLPLFVPAEVRVEHWREQDRRVFVLRDEASQRPHLAGTVEGS